MTYKQAFPLLGIVLMLVGCVRTSPDSFDTVGSQGNEVVIPADPTEEDDVEVVVIDPDDDTADAQTDDSEDAEPTATNRVVVPATETESSVEEAPTTAPRNADDDASTQADDDVQVTSTPQVVPTATDFEFITPDVVEEVVQPTAVPTDVTTTPTLQPTPTAEGDEVTLGTCDYEVQANDNLFRIALNNDVSLDALLAENGLTEASIIQPGQILTIPNCDAPEEAPVAETEDTETVDGAIVLPEECTYEVQTNDTLFQIALDNDVTLDELFAENGLTQNSILQVGQQLRIPLPQCDVEASASSTTEDTDSETVETGATTGDTIIYVVDDNDTLLSIAQTYGVTPNDIIQANTIPDPNNLTPGQELVIPTGD